MSYKKNEIVIPYDKNLSRMIVIPVNIKKVITYFIVKFNKKTNYFDFNTEPDNEYMKKNGIDVKIIRNIGNCPFCNTFLNLENYTDENTDYKNKFLGINKNAYKHVVMISSEKYDLNERKNQKKFYDNYLKIYGFKFLDCENEYYYYFIQRKLYNDVSKISTIRTAGIKYFSQRGEIIVKRCVDYFNQNSLEKTKADKLPTFNSHGVYSEMKEVLGDDFVQEDNYNSE